jgi:hypothetical protein
MLVNLQNCEWERYTMLVNLQNCEWERYTMLVNLIVKRAGAKNKSVYKSSCRHYRHIPQDNGQLCYESGDRRVKRKLNENQLQEDSSDPAMFAEHVLSEIGDARDKDLSQYSASIWPPAASSAMFEITSRKNDFPKALPEKVTMKLSISEFFSDSVIFFDIPPCPISLRKGMTCEGYVQVTNDGRSLSNKLPIAYSWDTVAGHAYRGHDMDAGGKVYSDAYGLDGTDTCTCGQDQCRECESRSANGFDLRSRM